MNDQTTNNRKKELRSIEVIKFFIACQKTKNTNIHMILSDSLKERFSSS